MQGLALRSRLSMGIAMCGGKAATTIAARRRPSLRMVASAIAARRPPIQIMIDAGYDDVMDDRELKSLATQTSYCHGAASSRKHSHLVTLAICGLTGAHNSAPGSKCTCTPRNSSLAATHRRAASENAPKPGQLSSLSALLAAGLDAWGVPYTSGNPAALQRSNGSIIYLSPDADEVLEELVDEDIYVIGGLIDRKV